MEHLTEKHISEITTLVRAKGVEMEELLYDLVDHVCCMVEEKMEQGKNYASALEESISSFGNNGIRNIQEETTYLLTKNILVMRKTMHIIGIATTIMLLVGVIFKIQHLPGAGILYLTGGFLFGFVFLPILAMVKIKEKPGKLRAVGIIAGIISVFILVNGIFFKIMHWPMASLLMNTGGALLLFVYLPMAIYAAVKFKDVRSSTITSIVLSIAGFCIIFALVKLRNSHDVDETILNIHNSIVQSTSEAVKNNKTLFVSIERDTLQNEKIKSIQSLSEEINSLTDELSFKLAISLNEESTEDQIRQNVKNNYEKVIHDNCNLTVLATKEGGLEEYLEKVNQYKKMYSELTGFEANININQKNMEFYLNERKEKFPLDLVVHDIITTNQSVQQLQTGLLQYFKGRVS